MARSRRYNSVSDIEKDIPNRRKKMFKPWGLFVLSRYYIVDLRNLLKPRYIPKPFDSVQECIWIINARLGGDRKRFTIEQGKTILKYEIKAYQRYLRKEVSKAQLSLKYQYPTYRVTNQQKKDFRTIARRRMRKWNQKLENK